MPKKVHDRLEREADKKGLKGERKAAYVYGTLNRLEKKKDSMGKRKTAKKKLRDGSSNSNEKKY